MISLGHRRPRHADAAAIVVDALADARRRPRHAPVPVEPRPPGVPRGGRALLRRAASAWSSTRPRRSSPRSAPRSASSTSTWPSSTRATCALAADPGYPVYTGGPLLAGAEPVLMPLLPERGFAPDLDAIAPRTPRARAADVPELPEQPDRRGGAGRAVRGGGGVRPRARHPRRARRLVHRDDLRRLRGAELPRDAGRQGGRRRGLLAVQGLQHDRLAHGGDRRQRRRRRGLLAAQDEHRLGHVRGGAAGGRRPRSTRPRQPRAR